MMQDWKKSNIALLLSLFQILQNIHNIYWISFQIFFLFLYLSSYKTPIDNTDLFSNTKIYKNHRNNSFNGLMMVTMVTLLVLWRGSADGVLLGVFRGRCENVGDN